MLFFFAVALIVLAARASAQLPKVLWDQHVTTEPANNHGNQSHVVDFSTKLWLGWVDPVPGLTITAGVITNRGAIVNLQVEAFMNRDRMKRGWKIRGCEQHVTSRASKPKCSQNGARVGALMRVEFEVVYDASQDLIELSVYDDDGYVRTRSWACGAGWPTKLDFGSTCRERWTRQGLSLIDISYTDTIVHLSEPASDWAFIHQGDQGTHISMRNVQSSNGGRE